MTMQKEIWAVLPQRYPLLLVDKILHMEPHKSVTAIKNVSANENCYRGMIAGASLEAYSYPWSLVIESFAQSAGILLNNLWEGRMATSDHIIMFGVFHDIRFYRLILPGDVMVHKVELLNGFNDSAIIGGTVTVDDELALEVERIIAVIRPKEYFEPKEGGPPW